MSTKRMSPEDPIYPPKKRALFEHKRQEELSKKGNEKLNVADSTNDFLFMKMKLESSQTDLICMRPRSDSLQSMHSLISDHSEQSNSTGSREPSPNMFDSRTPERNPVDFYKPEISKPLFPDLWKIESDVNNERRSEKMSLEERNDRINSETENETNPSNNNPNQISSKNTLNKNFNELEEYEAQKDMSMTGESTDNQSQTATLHITEQSSLTKDSEYVGPMVSLISRFNQEAVKKHLNPNISNIVPSIFDSNDGEKELNFEVENRAQSITNISLTDTDMFKCRICDKKFSVHDHLKAHMQEEHSGPLPYKCQHCPRAFGQYNNLQRHLRVHRAKIYKCKLCEREFNEEFYLKMHMGTHTGKRVYSCGVCSASFSSNQDLKLHVKTHSPSKLHTCDVCGKSFSKACVLRQHKKGHSGERPHKCDKCPKTFIHRHHLTMHLKSHSEEKQYTCEVCKKEFYQSSHLYKHLKLHEEGQNHTGEVLVENEKLKIDDSFSETCDEMTKAENSRQRNNRVLNKPVCDNLPRKNEQTNQKGSFPASVPTTRKLPSLSEAFYPSNCKTNLPINPYSNHGKQMSMAYNQPIPIRQGPYYSFQQQNVHSAMNSQMQAYYDYVCVKQMIEKVKYNQVDNSTKENLMKPLNRSKEYIVKQPTSARDHNDIQESIAKENIVKQPNKPLPTQKSDANGNSSLAYKQEKFETEISTSEAAVELIKMSGSVRNLNESKDIVKSLQGSLRNIENLDSNGSHKQAVKPSEQLLSTNNETLNWHRPFQPSSANTVTSSIYAAPTSLASMYYGQNHSFNPSCSFLSAEMQYNYPQNKHDSIFPRYYSLNRQYPYYNIGLAQYQNSHYQPINSLWRGQGQHGSQHLPLNLTSPNSPKKRHYSSQDVNMLKEKQSDDVPSNHVLRQRHMSESPKTNTSSHSLSYPSSTVLVSPATKYGMEEQKKGKINKPVMKLDVPEGTTKDTYESYSRNITDSPESAQSLDNDESIGRNHEASKTESMHNVDEDMHKGFDTTTCKNSEKVIELAEALSPYNCSRRIGWNDLGVDRSTKVEETEIRHTDHAWFGKRNGENKKDIVTGKEDFKERDDYTYKGTGADRVKDTECNGIGEESSPTTNINVHNLDKTSKINTGMNDIKYYENGEVDPAEPEEILIQKQTQDGTSTNDLNVNDNRVSHNDTPAIHDSSGALDLSLREQNEKIQNGDNGIKNETCKESELTNVEHGFNDGDRMSDLCVLGKLPKMQEAQIPDKVPSSDVFNMCGICWKKFDNSTDLQMHQIEHAQKLEHSNRCHICGRTFTKSFDLQCHIMKHRQESLNTISKLNGYLYPLDGNKLSENSKNRSEIRKQSHRDKENDALALQTGSRYGNKLKAGMLSNTVRSYIENQPTQTGCSYGINKLDKMDESKVDHSTTKQTGLDIVNQNDSSEENIRLNKSVWKTSEMDQSSKGYKCEICLRDFAHKHNLARHKMSHNQKSFKCRFCDRTFKEKFYLQMHEKTHTDENLVDCEICGETVPKIKYWHHANEHLGIIANNPTYEQIGHHVKELLIKKHNNENLNTKIDTRKVLGERKENVSNSKARNGNVVKSFTNYATIHNDMRGNEENIENAKHFSANNCFLQKPAKQVNNAFKLKN